MKAIPLEKTYSFKLFHSVHDIIAAWNELAPQSQLLSVEYLGLLESYRPENMNFRYAIVYKSKEPIAGFYFQLIPFNAADRLQLEELPRDSMFSCMYRHLKKMIARKVDFVTLICGNLLATGPYGFVHKPSLAYEELQSLFNQVLRILFQHVDWIDHASVCLVKELPLAQQFDSSENSNLKYFHPFFIQPSMILGLRKEWNSMDDYLNDLQSKYRLRIRKALHASGNLLHRELDLNDVKTYREKIYDLYYNTADGADFNLVKLHAEYFLQLKQALGKRYRLFGFFKDDELIAFYSFIDDREELMGHFLGTMKENNLKYQVYMNILLKYIQHGIDGKYEKINLARTAIEIKSSVGAVPVDMICYLAHRNRIYNAFVPNLIRYLRPQDKFIVRQPFKKLKDKNTAS